MLPFAIRASCLAGIKIFRKNPRFKREKQGFKGLTERGLNPYLGAVFPMVEILLMGRRQVASLRFLVSSFAGSNPAAPTKLCDHSAILLSSGFFLSRSFMAMHHP